VEKSVNVIVDNLWDTFIIILQKNMFAPAKRLCCFMFKTQQSLLKALPNENCGTERVDNCRYVKTILQYVETFFFGESYLMQMR
jgi:hypothetical protein